MKRLMACLFLIVPFLLIASPIGGQTPPKLESFILTKIGKDAFFQGKNKGVKKIEIRLSKDTVYYPFDLYKSVSMATGMDFDAAHTSYDLRYGEHSYILALRLETVLNPTTNLKNSVVILVFTK